MSWTFDFLRYGGKLPDRDLDPPTISTQFEDLDIEEESHRQSGDSGSPTEE